MRRHVPDAVAKIVIAKDVHGGSHNVPTSCLRWRPSAYAIARRDDCVLVVPDRRGWYDLPGGGLDYGEMPEAAVIRETFEETGLRIKTPRLVHAASSFFQMPQDQTDFIQSIMLYYTVQVAGGDITDKHFVGTERTVLRMAEWLPLSALDNIMLTSSVDWRPIVRQVV